jgi:hypothetical protein
MQGFETPSDGAHSMPYDEQTAARFRRAVEGLPGLSEKRMMGGLCFLVGGNMIGGVTGAKSGASRLLFRVGKVNDSQAALLPGGAVMVQGGRKMSGFYFVDSDCPDDVFRPWLSLAVQHALSLPDK